MRPKLLYISPSYPCPTANGRDMRGWKVMDALSRKYDVYLLSPPPYKEVNYEKFWKGEAFIYRDLFELPRRALLRFFPQWVSAPKDYFHLTKRKQKQLDKVFPGLDFEEIHIYRFFLYPIGQYLNQRFSQARLHLDLDDIESRTRHRIGSIYEKNGQVSEAKRHKVNSLKYRALENVILPTLKHMSVGSFKDKQWLSLFCPEANITVLPNTVEEPKALPMEVELEAKDSCFTFLFVGTLNYYPNEDALRFFCSEVLPLLKGVSFKLKVVGYGAPESLVKYLLDFEEIEYIGPIQDLNTLYIQSNAVLVPLRAGGGTRIKILEAFSYAKPVVSTPMGIEGIDAVNGEHALIEGSPEGLAQACIKLIEDKGLAAGLGIKGRGLFKEKYHQLKIP